MPNLTIDGKQVEVPAGTTIIQAADKLGIDIPRYCYHPALPVSGNCRICMVEVEKQPKLQIACYTPVTDGMVVKTNSPKVLKSVKPYWNFYWSIIRWIARSAIRQGNASSRIITWSMASMTAAWVM